MNPIRNHNLRLVNTRSLAKNTIKKKVHKRSGKSILFIEDSIDDYVTAEWAMRHLNLNHRLYHTESANDAFLFLDDLIVAKEPLPDLILVNQELKDDSAIDFLKGLYLIQEFSNLRVLVIGETIDEEMALACYEMGASSCLDKPSNMDGFIGLFRYIDEHWMHQRLQKTG